MCSLCGVLGGNEHWADAVARPGVYTRNVERIDRRRERANRVRIANRDAGALRSDHLRLAGRVLRACPPGPARAEIIEDLGHLWPAAERLCGPAAAIRSTWPWLLLLEAAIDD